MSGVLKDKVILITGSGSGIGRATALACTREGARVVVSDLNPEWSAEDHRRGDILVPLFIAAQESPAKSSALPNYLFSKVSRQLSTGGRPLLFMLSSSLRISLPHVRRS